MQKISAEFLTIVEVDTQSGKSLLFLEPISRAVKLLPLHKGDDCDLGIKSSFKPLAPGELRGTVVGSVGGEDLSKRKLLCLNIDSNKCEEVISNPVSYRGFVPLVNHSGFIFGYNKLGSEFFYDLIDVTSLGLVARFEARLRNPVFSKGAVLSSIRLKKDGVIEKYSSVSGDKIEDINVDFLDFVPKKLSFQGSLKGGDVFAFYGAGDSALCLFDGQAFKLLFSSSETSKRLDIGKISPDLLSINPSENLVTLSSSFKLLNYDLNTSEFSVTNHFSKEVSSKLSFPASRVLLNRPLYGPFSNGHNLISCFSCRPDDQNQSFNGVYSLDLDQNKLIYFKSVQDIFGVEGYRNEMPGYINLSKDKIVLGFGSDLLVKEGHDIPLY